MLKDQKKQLNENPFTIIALVLFTTIAIALPLAKVNLTHMIFGEIKPPAAKINQVTQSAINAPPEVITPITAKEPVRSEIKPRLPQPENYTEDSVYKYTDANGVLAMVDSLDKVPKRYRAKMKVSAGSNNSSATQRTAVVINNNRIFVPVSIGYQGRTINVRLLLDTGAEGIIISPAIAQRLGIRRENTRQGASKLANGVVVANFQTTADFVSVGPKIKRDIAVHVLPQSGSEEAGLLGMSFLSEFPHMIDMKSQVIKWM